MVQIYKTNSTFFQETKTLLSKSDIPGFIVNIDEVERRTGLDFNNLLWALLIYVLFVLVKRISVQPE